MNNKEIASIKEVINNLLELRDEEFYNSVIAREDIHFYRDMVSNLNEENSLDMSLVYEQLGISEEDYEEMKEFTRPNEEELEEKIENQFYKYREVHSDLWTLYVSKYDKPLVKLNNLLSDKEQYDEIKEIEKEMVKLNNKKYLTVKEFSEKYNISKTSQQNYRGRLYDPLPYHQKVMNGKITYLVEEVEKWFENQHKSGKL